MSADILVVDDEVDIRELVAGILEDEGHRTRTAGTSDDALAAIETRRPHLVFLDIWLQGSRLDGLQVLEIVKSQHPDLPVVMISGHGNIETAVSAIKAGAYDFIEKPFKADRLVLVAERALEASRLKREVRDLRSRSVQASRIAGRSIVINQLRQAVERAAPTNARILITGAPGSGKELTARTVHLSTRASSPFVVVSAATITPETMEAELFGTESGAGGARRVGALEGRTAARSTSTRSPTCRAQTQSRILRVLVDQNFQRVGGTTRVHVDVRIVSSSSRDLPAEIAAGRFREDLFHRLGVIPIRVPSLSERREDVPELIEFFMDQISSTTGLPKRRIAEDAMAVLQSHDWPGNVRQLRNNVERLMILSSGDPEAEITADMLPSEIGALVPSTPGGAGGEKLMSLPLREAREIFEREYLLAQIARFSGNISRTAEFIGMERSALHRKLKSLGIGG
ncbi:sigma-54-dependent Fis family transcriptional regulator [Microvirga ossetica]|uniref:Sigma-54-dependent Fis family transcriptional regulator n=1 Tax=Microvirga ossetica TaxID=1882682 RepID=A0A1B2ENE9_9HYPH|nr:sigma-54-dependent Fis family transcriptional regulator [Microvirga ossetica]